MYLLIHFRFREDFLQKNLEFDVKSERNATAAMLAVNRPLQTLAWNDENINLELFSFLRFNTVVNVAFINV